MVQLLARPKCTWTGYSPRSFLSNSLRGLFKASYFGNASIFFDLNTIPSADLSTGPASAWLRGLASSGRGPPPRRARYGSELLFSRQNACSVFFRCGKKMNSPSLEAGETAFFLYGSIFLLDYESPPWLSRGAPASKMLPPFPLFGVRPSPPADGPRIRLRTPANECDGAP